MRHIFTAIALCLLFTTAHLVSFGQAPAKTPEKIRYAGRDFWMSLYRRGASFNELYITGAADANITLTYTATNVQQQYTLQGGTVQRITLPNTNVDQMATNSIETVTDKSLHIEADTDVVVQYVTWYNDTDDGTLLLPSDRQDYGNIYYLNGPAENAHLGVSVAGAFTLVATCDSTVLQITAPVKTATHPANTPFQVVLNRGESYTLANRWTNDIYDLSGTKIEVLNAACCNPINVFNTYAATNLEWPNSLPYPCCADQLLEQVLPAGVWDTLHHIVPFVNCGYTVVKIVSGSDNNLIAMDGNLIAVLPEGGKLDTMIDVPVIVRSSGPVGITQYMISESENQGFSLGADSMCDPNASWVMPLRDGLRETYFTTAGVGYPEAWGTYSVYNTMHVLALVSRQGNINSISLNGASLAPQFQLFPGDPAYAYANIRLDTGLTYHLLSDERIIAYYYAAQGAGTLDFHLGDIHPSWFYKDVLSDTLLTCVGDTTLLSTDPALWYLWSTGERTAAVSVTDTGTYSVIKYYDDDCIGQRESYSVLRRPSTVLPFDLGSDTLICEGGRLVLKAEDARTVWSDSTVGKEMLVPGPGKYWAWVADSCAGTHYSDTIHVAYKDCPELYCTMLFPNAFSPNGDGLNDVYKPASNGAISNYVLNIFNRWGQRVFYSNNLESGWDGSYKNQPAQTDVYFYHCVYFCPVKGMVTVRGDISLVR